MLTLLEVFLILLVSGYAESQALIPAQMASAPQDTADTQQINLRANDSYSPITAKQRIDWTVNGTLGSKNLLAGLVVAGWGTWHNNPPEYGPHWDGFGKRYGLRLTAGGTSNVLEASLGSLWGEDPRYFRAAGQPLVRRVRHVFSSVFVTRDISGNPRPAYARYVAIPSGNLVSNAWRPDSQTTAMDVSVRIGLGFVTRLVGNALSEFLPDLRRPGSVRANPAGAMDAK